MTEALVFSDTLLKSEMLPKSRGLPLLPNFLELTLSSSTYLKETDITSA